MKWPEAETIRKVLADLPEFTEWHLQLQYEGLSQSQMRRVPYLGPQSRPIVPVNSSFLALHYISRGAGEAQDQMYLYKSTSVHERPFSIRSKRFLFTPRLPISVPFYIFLKSSFFSQLQSSVVLPAVAVASPFNASPCLYCRLHSRNELRIPTADMKLGR